MKLYSTYNFASVAKRPDLYLPSFLSGMNVGVVCTRGYSLRHRRGKKSRPEKERSHFVEPEQKTDRMTEGNNVYRPNTAPKGGEETK